MVLFLFQANGKHLGHDEGTEPQHAQDVQSTFHKAWICSGLFDFVISYRLLSMPEQVKSTQQSHHSHPKHHQIASFGEKVPKVFALRIALTEPHREGIVADMKHHAGNQATRAPIEPSKQDANKRCAQYLRGVKVNQSEKQTGDDDRCSWIELAQQLLGNGSAKEELLYDRSQNGNAEDAQPATRDLLEAGLHPVGHLQQAQQFVFQEDGTNARDEHSSEISHLDRRVKT